MLYGKTHHFKTKSRPITLYLPVTQKSTLSLMDPLPWFSVISIGATQGYRSFSKAPPTAYQIKDNWQSSSIQCLPLPGPKLPFWSCLLCALYCSFAWLLSLLMLCLAYLFSFLPMFKSYLFLSCKCSLL